MITAFVHMRAKGNLRLIYKGETEYIQDDDLYYTEYQIRIVISDNTQFILEISRNNASYTVRCTAGSLVN